MQNLAHIERKHDGVRPVRGFGPQTGQLAENLRLAGKDKQA